MNHPSFNVKSDYDRGVRAKTLEAAIYGAFITAVESRKSTTGLTRRALAEGSGRDETAISKLFARPGNWTIKTISDVSSALDLDFEFALVDRTDREQAFTATGTSRISVFSCYSGDRSNWVIQNSSQRAFFQALFTGENFSSIKVQMPPWAVTVMDSDWWHAKPGSSQTGTLGLPRQALLDDQALPAIR